MGKYSHFGFVLFKLGFVRKKVTKRKDKYLTRQRRLTIKPRGVREDLLGDLIKSTYTKGAMS